jgi:thiamine biosynthesis lipoprotein
MEISFGAIGKGWALDRVSIGLRARGVDHALLSAGHSSVLAIGTCPRAWPIDLMSPRVAARLARVELRHGSLGTSGAGEQFTEADGKRYGHVLDPRTGWPTESGLLSVSVLADDAAVSDALSTAFLVGGIDLARRYCAAHPGVMAVVTSEDRCTQVLGEFSGATVTLH